MKVLIATEGIIIATLKQMMRPGLDEMIRKLNKLTNEAQKCSEKAYILFYRLIKPNQFLNKAKALISNSISTLEESKTGRAPQQNSNSKINRKRRKITPPVKSAEP